MFGIKKRVAPFLTWSGEQRAYVDALPAKTKKAREALGKAGTKSDVLQREPLAAWFTAVQQLPNPIIAACLQMMLLTGARPGEVLALRWEDVNTQWKGIEVWILEQAGIVFDANAAPGGLRVVAG